LEDVEEGGTTKKTGGEELVDPKRVKKVGLD